MRFVHNRCNNKALWLLFEILYVTSSFKIFSGGGLMFDAVLNDQSQMGRASYQKRVSWLEKENLKKLSKNRLWRRRYFG